MRGGLMPLLLSALLLGLLQGLTEFLPISSSGHLVVAQSLLPGFSQPGALFDAALHVGTLAAVCVYFRQDLWDMLRASLSRDPIHADSRRLLWLLIVGSIPTAIIGLSFRHHFERMFHDASGVSIWFLVTGTLLFLSDRITRQGRKLTEMRILDALVIGVAQGLAIIPAVSRSGATIAAGVFLGLERSLLVRYSFLLSIPAVAGAFILQLGSHWQEIPQLDLFAYGAGTLAAATVGYWSISVLLAMTQSRRLSPFAYYCWAMGVFAFVLSTTR
jgi:undecaprenyl-diphosphatase